VKERLDFDEDFYNLTWTYKLKSDIPFFYGIARSINPKKFIGPKINAEWKEVEENFTGSTGAEK
jgi:hypothetical protein